MTYFFKSERSERRGKGESKRKGLRERKSQRLKQPAEGARLSFS
jgi:hypothetical protein